MAQKLQRANIGQHEWAAGLARLRAARALLLADAEAFHDGAIALEAVGALLSEGKANGLNDYQELLVALAVSGGSEVTNTQRHFDRIRMARNDHVHRGAQVRHKVKELVSFILLLERAIMDRLTTVREVMISDPTVAEPWHRVDDIRVLLLASSFSTVPYLWNDRWYFIADFHLLDFLRPDPRGNGSKRLGDVVGTAIKPKLARTVAPSKLCCDVRLTQWPVLVVEQKRLVGILTAFDLL